MYYKWSLIWKLKLWILRLWFSFVSKDCRKSSKNSLTVVICSCKYQFGSTTFSVMHELWTLMYTSNEIRGSYLSIHVHLIIQIYDYDSRKLHWIWVSFFLGRTVVTIVYQHCCSDREYKFIGICVFQINYRMKVKCKRVFGYKVNLVYIVNVIIIHVLCTYCVIQWLYWCPRKNKNCKNRCTKSMGSCPIMIYPILQRSETIQTIHLSTIDRFTNIFKFMDVSSLGTWYILKVLSHTRV